MKKNMFNVIKLMVIIPMILTTCNIGFHKVDDKKTTQRITPKYLYQKDYKIDDEEVTEEQPIEDETITEEATEEYNNDVMGEINDVSTYNEPEVEIVYEPVQETTPATVYYNEDYAYQVLYLINQIRKENGLGELTMNYTLIQVANVRSEEATRNWSHTRPDGSAWWTVHQQYGLYGKFGENLAYGQESPAEVVQAWMDSEGHRANILTSDFTTIGISCYYNDGEYYWSQEFAG